MNLSNIDVGYWVENVPYIYRPGNTFEEGVRMYFIHENSTVYTSAGPVQLYTLLGNDKTLEDVYLAPFTSEDECRGYFRIKNPYFPLPEGYEVWVNDQKFYVEGESYRFLRKLSLRFRGFCPEKYSIISHGGDKISLPLNPGECLQRLGNFRKYSLPLQRVEEVKNNLDLSSIIQKNLMNEGPPRNYNDFVEELPSNFPRLKWRKNLRPDPPNTHWGQFKLLMSEIDFLTHVMSRRGENTPSPIVVYAGAAAGYHIPILTNLFPQIFFILYDPGKFGIKPTPNIVIRQEFFTDEVAKLYRNLKVIFISDIRLTEDDEKKFEKLVHENNLMNIRWVEEMNPEGYSQDTPALLKFRFPFDGITPRKFFDGRINLQVYAPNTSAETRFEPSSLRKRDYDTIRYEEQLFYFNVKYRNCSFLDYDEIYGVNYDTYRTYIILERYLLQMDVVDGSSSKTDLHYYVAAMILEMEGILRKNIVTKNLGWNFKPRNIPSKPPLQQLPHLPVKKVEYYGPEGVSGGVSIFTTDSGEKYIIKPEFNVEGHLQANKIAQILGINVPESYVISKDQIPDYENFIEDYSDIEKFEDGYEDLGYILMEYIPNAVPLKNARIPSRYCDDMYDQLGKIVVFDVLVWNFDRFYYFDTGRLMKDVNDGNIIYSKITHKVYSIDHEVNKRNQYYSQQYLFDAIFGGDPLPVNIKELIEFVPQALGNDECKNMRKIIESVTDTVKEVYKNYSRIKQVWPDVPPLPKK